MRLLLDTHIFVWSRLTPGRLSPKLKRTIVEADDVFVSMVSVVEIAIKVSLRKLDVPTDLEAQINAAGYKTLPITFQHCELLRGLPFHHRDPFDRLLIAQCQAERLTLLTADSRLLPYDVSAIDTRSEIRPARG